MMQILVYTTLGLTTLNTITLLFIMLYLKRRRAPQQQLNNSQPEQIQLHHMFADCNRPVYEPDDVYRNRNDSHCLRLRRIPAWWCSLLREADCRCRPSIWAAERPDDSDSIISPNPGGETHLRVSKLASWPPADRPRITPLGFHCRTSVNRVRVSQTPRSPPRHESVESKHLYKRPDHGHSLTATPTVPGGCRNWCLQSGRPGLSLNTRSWVICNPRRRTRQG